MPGFPVAAAARVASSLRSAMLLLPWIGLLAWSPARAAVTRTPDGIRFTYRNPTAAQVAWAGDFNGWNTSANPFTKSADGTWSVLIALPSGTHAYKFVVDGQWLADPENPVTAGEFGNSMLVLGTGGDIVAQQATSNTSYSPKIFVDGRMIGLYQAIFDPRFSRYELVRPRFDIDLGFDIHVSDALTARWVLNVNPEFENVQDYRSRLNFKRGALTLTRPGFRITAFDSETIGTWDDPFRLVGAIGVFDHPYGFNRQGLLLDATHSGVRGELLYADNFDDRLSSNSDVYQGFRIDNFPTFTIGDPLNPTYQFDANPLVSALGLLATARDGSGFAVIPGQATKIQSLDFGDNGSVFGFGDNNENAFAGRLRRAVGPVELGLLARSDRGFGFGRLVLAEPISTQQVEVLNSLYTQEWFGAGAEASWKPSSFATAFAEVLVGARRMSFVNGSTRSRYTIVESSANGVRVSFNSDSIQTRSADGDHETTDRSTRFTLGGTWNLAQGDIGLRGRLTHETHRYPAWTQAPTIPAGLPAADFARFRTVEYQRAGVRDADAMLTNAMTTLQLVWDRNWRYYVGRELKSTLDVEWTNFDYDARTSWNHQLWFPTGNFWLENGGHLVSVDRLTSLGETQALRVRPRIEVPLRRARDVRIAWSGTFTGVSLSKSPRYAEQVFQLGVDLLPNTRFESDTRWVKYDAPGLGLGGGYVSTFNEATVRFAPGIEVGFGVGVDPNVLDPNLNDYARIGRDVFLNDRGANGFVAETNWTSLAPQIRAAEKALQNEKRLQVQAIVRF